MVRLFVIIQQYKNVNFCCYESTQLLTVVNFHFISLDFLFFGIKNMTGILKISQRTLQTDSN